MRKAIYVIGICLLLSGCGRREATEYYQQYSRMPHVKAMCFIGYKLDKSHETDITLLQAADEDTFNKLLDKIGIDRRWIGHKKVVVAGTRTRPDGKRTAVTIGASGTYRSVYIFEYKNGCDSQVLHFMAQTAKDYLDTNKIIK